MSNSINIKHQLIIFSRSNSQFFKNNYISQCLTQFFKIKYLSQYISIKCLTLHFFKIKYISQCLTLIFFTIIYISMSNSIFQIKYISQLNIIFLNVNYNGHICEQLILEHVPVAFSHRFVQLPVLSLRRSGLRSCKYWCIGFVV